MLQLILILCVAFTMYFLARISYITLNDLKNTPREPKFIFLKKYTKKFCENFIYHLP
ncbi:hypothetical protein [Salmonella phage SPTD1]|nr:hypothetical protein Marshall_67 [Salmonella phage Marshall]YP_009293333.1 hypothetical protein BI092_gp085 [Salmonella phage vB-SalM-PM10]YP_009880141.1 hypothetical protein HYP60_gp002 [Escherichia phage EP75]YP_009966612.1 hypothetical protein HYQ26_gp099 [Salmonella phage Se-G]AXC40849.1 hypothetical protein [Salmonella phage S117]AXY85178.1 hypothetical protein Mooltan_074 [Salmonella phage Mooltan]QEA10192.1 hypothetical protein CPT_Matapan_081 [Salmonella phage Matapan]QKE54785.1 h